MRELSGRFTVVDALRGAAAMGVVLYHAVSAGHVERLMALFPAWVEAGVLHAGLGVAVFFVLSGFVIAHSLYNRPMTLRELGRFTLKRSLRLDPAYWVSIAATIAFAVLSSYVVAGREMPIYTAPQILAHIFYVQDLLDYPAISPVFWTLCLEIQFYLVYALLIGVSGFRPAGIVAACAVSLVWPLGLGPELWSGLFLPLWYGFLLGVAVYWTWQQPRLVPLFLIYATVLLLSGLWADDAFRVVCSATALSLFWASIYGQISVGLNWRWLQFLGLISYSLYLTHNIVTGGIFRIATMLGPRSSLGDLVWWGLSILGCVSFATVFWWLFERPSMDLSKRVGQRKNAGCPPQSPAPIAVSQVPH
ncbi:putative Acyltransferase 3 [Pseudorhizobium banfieldiae]|uniref:Putative Acyltransferase 3 n=1 Tax=Pseudorhizobium banfieldiae TaxID=1125847 RepID=L0NHC9_9HYPH|nr:acyltransferase [Pseudorhizobium banfieldiae]CAD6616481.1 acyltransferase [arsenite-oxidising bacterium NT-25]CCF20518.1 putative Acyltransferase 3 [Pseudorhizobium banfieldiae]